MTFSFSVLRPIATKRLHAFDAWCGVSCWSKQCRQCAPCECVPVGHMKTYLASVSHAKFAIVVWICRMCGGQFVVVLDNSTNFHFTAVLVQFTELNGPQPMDVPLCTRFRLEHWTDYYYWNCIMSEWCGEWQQLHIWNSSSVRLCNLCILDDCEN